MKLRDNTCAILAENDDACGVYSQIDYTATYTGYVYFEMSGLGMASGSYTMAYKVLGPCDAITAIADSLPDDWANETTAKCDVMFLFDAVDSPEILGELTIKPEIDDVRYVPGALLWRVDRRNVTRSGMLKIVGTDLYRQMTVRNCNTARKLAELARQADVAEP